MGDEWEKKCSVFRVLCSDRRGREGTRNDQLFDFSYPNSNPYSYFFEFE